MKLKDKSREALVGYSFILIWIIGFAVLTVYPMIQSMIFSFNTVRITPNGYKMVFIGWNNYKSILTTDLVYINAVGSYALQLLVYLPTILVFSVIIAILLNQRLKFRGIFRSIYFLPVIITSGPVINDLTNSGGTTVPLIKQYGVIGIIGSLLPHFLVKPVSMLFSDIIMILWFSGVQILLFLAGLQKIDKQIYEAASIDGASPWESFWKVTLPALKNIVIINAIFTIVMLSAFANNQVNQVISGNMFNPSTGYGYATAQAWMYFLLIFIILLVVTGLLSISGKTKRR